MANCSASAQSCYTGTNSAADCAAVLPHAQFGIDTTHSSQSAYAGPVTPPRVVKTAVYSGQASIPVSGLAVGPSGGVVAGRPYDALFFVGMSDDFFGVSSVNEALMNNYEMPTPSASYVGSPAVAPWGAVYVVDANFRLFSLPVLSGTPPTWVYTPPGGGSSPGYAATPPAAHSATRAVYYNAGPSGIVCVDISGTKRWSWMPPPPAVACSTTPALDLAGRSVFVGCDDYFVYAISASSGLTLWAHRTGGAVRASPALSADGALLFVSSIANNLLALNASSGEVLWLPVAVAPAAVLATPAVAPGAVIVGVTDGTLFAASDGGAVQWQVVLDGPIVAPPTLGAANATTGESGTAFVGTLAGSLYAVDVDTGRVKWREDVGEPVTQPAVILARGDTLLLPSNVSSSVFVVNGVAPSATPSATPSASTSASPSANATSPGGGGAQAAAAGLDQTTTIIIGVAVPLVLIAFAGGAMGRGLLDRRARAGGAGGAGGASEWGGTGGVAGAASASSPAQTQQKPPSRPPTDPTAPL